MKTFVRAFFEFFQLLCENLQPAELVSPARLKGAAAKGSFSAVSSPIFATKYLFRSIFRDLQDLHSIALLHLFFRSGKTLENPPQRPLQIQKFRNFFSNFCKFLLQIL